MAKKFSKAELKTIAEEIYTQLKNKLSEKNKKIGKEHREKFEQSEEYEKYTSCLDICGFTLDSNDYTKNRLHSHFYQIFEEDEPREYVSLNPKSIDQILHELCLEQIREGEDFNLDELINKYIEKYA